MIRVLLADDHPIVRQGVRSFVDAQGDLRVVGEAADAACLETLVASNGADVLVLDLSLPGGGSGLDLVRRVRTLAPRLPIVIFTMYAEDVLGLHFLKEGASAYLSKDRTAEELVTAIRRAAKRQRFVTDRLAELALTHGATADRPPHHKLSPREYQVFLLVVQGRGTSEIAHELNLNASTVSNHLAALREKLGVGSTTEIVCYAHRVGLLA